MIQINDTVVSDDRYAFLNGEISLQTSFSRTIALSTGIIGENVTIKHTDDYVGLFTRQNFKYLPHRIC